MAKKGKRKQNPMSKRMLRQPRPRAYFDGTVFKGLSYSGTVTGNGANITALSARIDVNASGSVAAPYAGITCNYAEYKYLNCVARWLPSVGPGVAAAGGRGYAAYVLNPEHIAGWEASSLAQQVADVVTMRNMKSFNVWEPFVYNIPMTLRRKMFDTNYTEASDVNVFDRSTQGLFVSAFETVGASDTVGKWIFEYTIQLVQLEAQGS